MANLRAGPGTINEVPTIVALCETSDAATQKVIEEAMTPIAKRYLDAQKAQGEEDPKLAFMISTETGGIGEQLRKVMDLPEVEGVASMPPRLMLLDIPSGGAFFEGPEGAITSDVLEKFVSGWEDSSLQRKQLKRC